MSGGKNMDSRPCPCAGRIIAAEHDINRFRQQREDYHTESLIQEALAVKAENERRKCVVRLSALQKPQDCQMCEGTGITHGNGSAMTGGRGATHAEEQPSYRAVKVG